MSDCLSLKFENSIISITFDDSIKNPLLNPQKYINKNKSTKFKYAAAEQQHQRNISVQNSKTKITTAMFNI